ncbi:MAG: carboxypeptidase-like regulatory domain-containing protein [Bacteroidetes bacterium]|nr:carboxypeptidase-like regulatory domain-containing protein [Bacteroidota bacterium]
MKKGILILVVSLITNLVVAGNGIDNKNATNTKLVSGKVIDKISGEEIAGAEIKIDGTIVYSDLNGNFSVNMNVAKTEVVVSFVSYNDTKLNIEPFSYNTLVVELESK